MHLGWGHSAISDTLRFARRANVRRLLAFHHDPLHSDDDLDALARRRPSPLARARRRARGARVRHGVHSALADRRLRLTAGPAHAAGTRTPVSVSGL